MAMPTMGCLRLCIAAALFFPHNCRNSIHAFVTPAPGGHYAPSLRLYRPPRHPLQATANSGQADLRSGLGEDEKSADDGDFTPPVFPKSAHDDKFIRTTLLTNFMFQSLPDESLGEITQAFERTECKAGQMIIRQGDCDADYFYIIAEGECSVEIGGRILPEPYGTLKAGSIFGELALLYDKPRAATVTARTPGTLFRVDRRSFLYFLNRGKARAKEDAMKELRVIDYAIDRVAGVKTRYGGTIIKEFNPRRFWLWRRWSGTVLQHAWKDAVINMLLSVATIAIVRRSVPCTWEVGLAPDPSHPVIGRLNIFGKLWHYLMTLTTFILTFFLSQAYSLWREVYSAARKIQGRLNDIGLLVATSAKREAGGSYTPEAESLLDDVAAYSRLFHVFMWAKFARKLGVLLTPRGMSRMLSRGLITKEQFDVLQARAPQVGAENVCLEWLTIRAIGGTGDGSLEEDHSLRHVLYEKICALRGTSAGIGDILDGRMPLAYAHFVQVLVDTFLISAPVALYAELGVWAVLCAGMLTLFYSGLLGLAKVFLDPLHNDDYYKESVNMDIGVLIREGNAGSTRWRNGAAELPF